MAQEPKKSVVLKKDQLVSIQTKDGKKYSYKFTSLAEIHRYLEETDQHYEAYVKKVDGDDYMFIRKLTADQETLVELQECKIPPVSGIKEYGAILTTVRRYSLLAAFGLACEDEEVAQNSPEKKWQKIHTPDPNKPATPKQIITIKRLCEDLNIPPRIAFSDYINPARQNQLAASEIIKKLIKKRDVSDKDSDKDSDKVKE